MSERTPVPAGTATPKAARASGTPAPAAGVPSSTQPIQRSPVSWPVWVVLATTAAGTIVLGLWQSALIRSIEQAVTALAMR